MTNKLRAVDLFAGLGGKSAGAEATGKVKVVLAANHNPLAIRYHSANHPGAEHWCQDLHQANFFSLPRHDLMLTAPACTGHTWARGTDQPRHDESRSTAWAVVSALEACQTPLATVENVPEFRLWRLFPAWVEALKALGYSVSPHEVDAADCGVAQHRRRLLIAITRSKHPVQLRLPRRQHVGAVDIIDFSRGSWSRIDKPGRARATLEKLQRGRKQHGDRFVFPYYGSGSGRYGRSLDRPLGTVTCTDRWGVVDGDRMRMLTLDEYRQAMGFDAGTILPTTRREAIHLLGNAVPPPMARDFVDALLAAV